MRVITNLYKILLLKRKFWNAPVIFRMEPQALVYTTLSHHMMWLQIDTVNKLGKLKVMHERQKSCDHDLDITQESHLSNSILQRKYVGLSNSEISNGHISIY